MQHKNPDTTQLLPVMEHFYTIQGEGFHQGRAAYFIRLGGCDVGCVWCDVKDSWDADKHPLTNVDELVDLATSQAKTIIITGGEPLMWDLTYLTKKLHEKGARIHIEKERVGAKNRFYFISCRSYGITCNFYNY